MSKFVCMNFEGNYKGREFVANAKKMTKEETVKEFNFQHCGPADEGLRKANIKDVEQSQVRWYVRPPETCEKGMFEGGCYSFCGKYDRGSFPVWVIATNKLKIKEGE